MQRPIVINARAAARPELGGVERIARELAVRLPALDPGGYRIVKPPPALVHRAGHAWEQGVLPGLARGARLLLNPANAAPLAFPRNVILIPDAAALREPAWYSALYARWQRAMLPALARRAVHVVTLSEFSKGEIVELLGADPAKVSVIPAGVDERFAPGADPAPARAALGLERPYVLTVGSRTARKNLGALRVTADRLRARGIDLLAVGGDRPQFRPEEGDLGLRWLGAVPDAHLPGLYAGAEAFVFPSLYEGFGLPPLEALACGTPVVAANVTALPEVLGDAATLVDPRDPEAIAGAVEAVLGTRAPSGRRFSWGATTQQLHELLCGLASGSGSAGP